MSGTDDWLTGRQVRERFNVSDMAIWRWLRDERLSFPRPTVIRRRNFWRRSDIESFEQRMIVASLRGRRQVP
jgi:predicted DNA-binding transcriptional regulator AlpA